MLKRSIGVGLLMFGLLTGAVAAWNLWTISGAWNDLESRTIAGMSLLGVSDLDETFSSLWNENLITLIGALLIAASGILISVGPRLRFLDRYRTR